MFDFVVDINFFVFCCKVNTILCSYFFKKCSANSENAVNTRTGEQVPPHLYGPRHSRQ